MSNENHRIAKLSELRCNTCFSYREGNCDSVDTSITKTFEHNTCNYHLIPPILVKLSKDTGTLQILKEQADKINWDNFYSKIFK